MISLSPAWEQFKAEERKPGLCVVCDRPLKGRKRVLCGSADCRRVFNTIYCRGYYHRNEGAK